MLESPSADSIEQFKFGQVDIICVSQGISLDNIVGSIICSSSCLSVILIIK